MDGQGTESMVPLVIVVLSAKRNLMKSNMAVSDYSTFPLQSLNMSCCLAGVKGANDDEAETLDSVSLYAAHAV
jgi:hypothetical protein